MLNEQVRAERSRIANGNVLPRLDGNDDLLVDGIIAVGEGVVYCFAQHFLGILRHGRAALGNGNADLDVAQDVGEAFLHQRQDIVD